MTDERLTRVGRANLLNELGGVFSDARLREWASGRGEQHRLLEGLVLGSIVWSKELGRPDTATFSDAFIVAHRFCDETPTVGQPPVDCKNPDAWESGDVPVVADGEDDEAHHRVGFACVLERFFPNKVEVALASDVVWQHEGHFTSGRPFVAPGEQAFRSGGEPIVLEFSLAARPRFEPKARGIE